MRQLVGVARARREQDFQRVFGRGLQIAAVGSKRDELRVGNAAGAQLRGVGFDDAARGEEGADGGEEIGAPLQALT